MPFASERVMGTSGACRSRAQGSGRHGFVPWCRLRYKARAAIVVTGWRVEFVLKENTPFERRWWSCTGNICVCSSFFLLVSSLVCARAEWQRERGLLREGRRGSGNNRFDFHLISCKGKAQDCAMASKAARVCDVCLQRGVGASCCGTSGCLCGPRRCPWAAGAALRERR